jgi:predicted peptidase
LSVLGTPFVSRPARAASCILVALAFSGCATSAKDATDDPPGVLVSRSVTVDGMAHQYAVWLPPHYNSGKRWPCVVFLHGSGECGLDGVKQTMVGLGPAAKAHPEAWPCIIIMPQKTKQDAEWEEYEPLVLSALSAMEREFVIDPARVSLTGLSQGGHGAWIMGARHPDLWSAVAPICGYGDPAAITGLAHTPVWAFHGELDTVVPPEKSKELIAELDRIRQREKIAAPARLTLYSDLDHNCWNRAYRESGLGPWLMSSRKE